MAELVEGISYQAMLRAVQSMTAAIEMCFRLAGKSPSEAAFDLGIDYSHFVRMMRATDARNFPPDLLEKAMKVWGNNFPLDWLAYRMGQTCYPREFMEVLNGIRDALQAEGKITRFACLPASVEVVQRAADEMRRAVGW